MWTAKSYMDMPALLEKVIGENNKVSMFPIHEYWLDIGNIPDYNRANAEVNGNLNVNRRSSD